MYSEIQHLTEHGNHVESLNGRHLHTIRNLNWEETSKVHSERAFSRSRLFKKHSSPALALVVNWIYWTDDKTIPTSHSSKSVTQKLLTTIYNSIKGILSIIHGYIYIFTIVRKSTHNAYFNCNHFHKHLIYSSRPPTVWKSIPSSARWFIGFCLHFN